jgi:hypothetical protein
MSGCSCTFFTIRPFQEARWPYSPALPRFSAKNNFRSASNHMHRRICLPTGEIWQKLSSRTRCENLQFDVRYFDDKISNMSFERSKSAIGIAIIKSPPICRA